MSWSKGRSRTIRKEILFSPEEWEQVKEDIDSVSTNFHITWTQYIRGLLWHEKFYQIVLPIDVEHTNKILDSIKDDVNHAYQHIEELDADTEQRIHEMAVAIDRMNDSAPRIRGDDPSPALSPQSTTACSPHPRG